MVTRSMIRSEQYIICAVLILFCLISSACNHSSEASADPRNEGPFYFLTQAEIDAIIENACQTSTPTWDISDYIQPVLTDDEFDRLVAGIIRDDPSTLDLAVLMQYYPDERISDVIPDFLNSKSSMIRIETIYYQFLFGDESSDWFSMLLDYLNNGTESEREWVGYILTTRGHPSDVPIPFKLEEYPELKQDFINAFNEGDLDAKGWLISQFWNMADDPEILDLILETTGVDSNSVQVDTLHTLNRLMYNNEDLKDNERLQDICVNLLQDGNYEVRDAACTFARYFESNERIFEILKDIYQNDRVEFTRYMALIALSEIGSTAEVNELILDAFHSENRRIFDGACRSVMYAEINADLITEINNLLNGETSRPGDYKSLGELYSSLPYLGEDACVFVPGLVSRIYTEEDGPIEIFQTLGHIGPCAEEAVPVIGEFLNDENEFQQRTAIIALGEISGAASQFYPELLSKAREGSQLIIWSRDYIREQAINALGKFEDERDNIVPALISLLEMDQGELIEINLRLALFRLGYNQEEQLEFLLDIIYTDQSVRDINNADDLFHAMWAVGELGPIMSNTLPRMHELMRRYPEGDCLTEKYTCVWKIEDPDYRDIR